MSRIAYVNGRYLPRDVAKVPVEDRGYQFADGVYEVCEVRHGLIVDLTRHLDRLNRSLGELRIAWPMSRAALIHVIRETLRRNHVRNGLFYLQVTRGVARRDHVFPAEGTPSSIVVTAKSTDASVIAKKNASGIKAITVRDNRWDRVDIKSVGLLSNALARQQAKEAGAQEAIYIDHNGMVKEGAATNVWIVDSDGNLVTRPAEHGILRGITRTVLIEVISAQGLQLEERPFTVEEAYGAREAFLTSASQIVMPVVRIDERAIGNGAPGSIATALRAEFHRHAEWT